MKIPPNKGKSLLTKLLHPLYLLKWIRYQCSLNPDRDVYLITLPHSGTHWLQMLITKSFIDYYDLDYKIGGVEGKEMAPVLKSKFENGAKKDLPQIQKFHFFYFFLFRNKKVLLLVRDLRDSIVSQYDKYNKNYEEISFSQFLRTEPGTNPNVHSIEVKVDLLNSWWENRDQLKDFLVVRYEDLVNNTEQELAEVLRFIGLSDVDNELLKEVVEFCSAENMKQMEKEEKDQANVVNKAKTGRYQDYFSEEDLNYFRKVVGERLIHDFGYNYEDSA